MYVILRRERHLDESGKGKDEGSHRKSIASGGDHKKKS
jgi:hypothetical protein